MMAAGIKKNDFVPKYAWLREQLRSRIRQMQPDQPLPTIAKIRAQYQVSQPTVDRAIQELRTEGLLISRRGSGIYVSKTAKVKHLGVLFWDDIFDSNLPVIYRQMLTNFQAACRSSGRMLSYYFDDVHHDHNEHGPSRLQLDVQSRQLDGLFAVGVPSRKYWEHLVAFGIPLEILTETNCSQRVWHDYFAVIQLGVKSLVEQGCRRIALWYNDTVSQRQQEKATFYEALACTTACTCPQWVFGADMDNRPLDLSGFTQFKQIWKSWDEKPDGIVCCDDNYTIGMLHAADTMGLGIPGELKVATQANKGLPKPSSSRVTRIEFDAEEIVAIMLKRLEQRMAGQTPKPDVLIISPHLADNAG